MKPTLFLLFIAYLCLCEGDQIHRKKSHYKHHDHKPHRKHEDSSPQQSSAHVVVSKEGPPPSPQEYTISKLEEAVVCDARGDKTWAKWKKYDLDGVCSRLQYYGEIEGQCETNCDALCPQGFYEVAKEECQGAQTFAGASGKVGSGFYRQCIGRYKCTQSTYDYWVNMKWWQFLLWELAIVILGCCFCGLAVGCCIRCYGQQGSSSAQRVVRNARRPRGANAPGANNRRNQGGQ
eukprot:179468_1